MPGHLSERQEHMFASTESARSDAMGDVGQATVFWITGMSGTGKRQSAANCGATLPLLLPVKTVCPLC